MQVKVFSDCHLIAERLDKSRAEKFNLVIPDVDMVNVDSMILTLSFAAGQ
jgi:hypothetical protein